MNTGRSVIITGGAGAIGRGLAELFARDNDRVAIADLDVAAAEAVANELQGKGLKAISVQVDVTDKSSAEAMVSDVVAALGGIDILVNNAGLFGKPVWTGPVLDIGGDQFDELFRVNVRGVLECTRAASDALGASGRGRVINISSTGAYSLGGAYSASKLAVNHLTWSLAVELGPRGVTVNCIGPGTMDTGSNRRNNPDPERLKDRIDRTFIIKRLGQPADIYAAARYFASEEASWCTGQTLLVDGGVNVVL
jgi:NAD(P)-dependent dehydrogenase (short-subunit alcohol dehydrogenase family)